jgi:hypothetical protein
MKTAKTQQTLKRAKQAIRKYGLAKKMFGEPEVGFCMLGAIGFVCPNSEQDTSAALAYNDATDILGGVLGARSSEGFLSVIIDDHDAESTIVNFNDARKTKPADVLAAFDEAIKLAKILGV